MYFVQGNFGVELLQSPPDFASSTLSAGPNSRQQCQGRTRRLQIWQVDRGMRFWIVPVQLHVRDHANHRGGVAIVQAQFERLADRSGVRPASHRQTLADDGDLRRCAPVAFCKGPALQQADAKRGKKVGAHDLQITARRLAGAQDTAPLDFKGHSLAIDIARRYVRGKGCGIHLRRRLRLLERSLVERCNPVSVAIALLWQSNLQSQKIIWVKASVKLGKHEDAANGRGRPGKQYDR